MSSAYHDRQIDLANLLAEIADEFLYACLLLKLGEFKEYERFCQELVSRPGQPDGAYAAAIMARVCAVGPSRAVPPARLIQWAKQGVAARRDAAGLHILGLACFRAGEYERASATLRESNAAGGWSEIAKAQNWLVLAMTHSHLEEIENARRSLETAQRLLAQVRPLPKGGLTSLGAADWIELNVLAEEAEKTLAAIAHRSIQEPPPTVDFIVPSTPPRLRSP